jgi:hypothetical protein
MLTWQYQDLVNEVILDQFEAEINAEDRLVWYFRTEGRPSASFGDVCLVVRKLLPADDDYARWKKSVAWRFRTYGQLGIPFDEIGLPDRRRELREYRTSGRRPTVPGRQEGSESA